VLLLFIERWNENRMRMEEEHGGYVPIEHTEVTRMAIPDNVEEEEVKESKDLY
jgi:hypothetical protein